MSAAFPFQDPSITTPRGWTLRPLGSIADIIAGQSPPGTTYRNHPEGLPFFQGKADFGPLHPVPRVWCASPTKIALAGDILISVRAPVGPTNVADRECCIGRGLAAIRCKPDAERDFVLFFLRLIELALARTGSGSTFGAINREALETIPVPFPPLSEQRRLAAKLREQLTAVELATRAAENRQLACELLLSSSLRTAFSGITPLTAERSRDEPLPGWRWRKLTDIARLESGHTPSRYHPEWWGGDIRWLALPDIRALDGREALETSEHTNELGIQNSSARLLPKGTVVLSRTASVGFVAVLGRPMATSQDFVNWVCGDELEPWFLAYLLMASRHYIRVLSSGAVHKTVYMPTAKAFEVCVPGLQEQRRIAARLAHVAAAATSAARAAHECLTVLHSLPASLLRRAFSGGA